MEVAETKQGCSEQLNKKGNWLNEELSACKFEDKRLDKRFKVICEQLWNNLGELIPFACQDL